MVLNCEKKLRLFFIIEVNESDHASDESSDETDDNGEDEERSLTNKGMHC